MNHQKGGILLQVITTATISLILVGSVSLMLQNQGKRVKMNEFIKKRDAVGFRLSNYVLLPDVLLASSENLPSSSSLSTSLLYGNYMLHECLGLGQENTKTYSKDNKEVYNQDTQLTLKPRSCVVKNSTNEDENWYPLLLVSTEDFKESGKSSCLYSGEDKWNNPVDCFLAGQTSDDPPSKQVAFSFEGKRGAKDLGHPLLSFIYFRPFCGDDELESDCYVANRLEFKYSLTHVWDKDDLDTCADLNDCEKNSPIKLGPFPKETGEYLSITAAEILGNRCNEHAKVKLLNKGGVECQCMSPYRQVLVESGGELYYKTNHKGPICELVDPLCSDQERLVGQTLDGVPICERIEEDVFVEGNPTKNTYQFEQIFYSYDSPIYSGASGSRYASNICDDTEQDGICDFYSCRYYDNNPADGTIQSNERVDGWVNDLQITCESYLKFNKVNTHDMYTGESYFEELVWGITEKTAAIFLALSENALWLPKLMTKKSEANNPGDISMLGRRDLLFPNVGERLLPDTQMVSLGGKQMNIPYCNTRRVLGDHAPEGAILYEDPRCPLVVCQYKMICEYAASNRELPTR